MTTPETMEERFDQEFVNYFGSKERQFFRPDTKTVDVKDFINQEITLAVQKREEELREKIEKIIQDERFSGAPHALNKVLNLLSPN